ncbi:MAG TPA: type I secretion system permease/ATPase [Allosphingosinicella sp.]|nr:type I secretion system permease/ATPase [Allosphingosinicella sp.]
MAEKISPSGVPEAQAAVSEAAAEIIAIDSAERASTLEHGDEFASALRQCKRLLWAAAAFSGAVNLLFLASPIYLIQIYGRVIPSGSIETLVSLSVGLVIALALMAVFDSVRARILIRAAARLDRVLAHRVFQAIVDLAPRNGAAFRNAQALRDLDQFRTALAGQGAQFFFDVPWMPLFIFVLFLIHPLLGFVSLFGAGLLLALAFWNDRRTRGSAGVAVEAANRGYQFTDAIARHAGPVRAMGMEDALSVRWHVDRDMMVRRQGEASDRGATAAAMIRVLRLGLQSSMIGFGALLAIRGDILPASIFAANLLLGRALAPLEVAVGGWRQIVNSVQAGRRVQKALVMAPARAARVKLPDRDVEIELSGVTYVPPGAQRPALKDVDLFIAAGEAVGIVGPSGAGKSCLARLLTSVTSPTSGRLTVGGIEGRLWTSEDLSRYVGYLPQSVGLFPGSIRDNICRFSNAEDDEVVEAARRANVHEMILELPEGYETKVHEGGSGLSGGQRQRIGLARAMFGSPRLLVLDEPNAHLDADGEEALCAALTTLKKEGSTIVLIAHRLNPIAFVDRVVVLCKGELQLDGPRARIFRKVKTEVVRSIAREPTEA